MTSFLQNLSGTAAKGATSNATKGLVNQAMTRGSGGGANPAAISAVPVGSGRGPIVNTPTTGQIFANTARDAAGRLFPSINKDFRDPRTGEPLTGLNNVLTRGASMVGDVANLGGAGEAGSPIRSAVMAADILGRGGLTKLVQNNILGGLNNGTPVTNFPDGTPVMAADLFTREGAALFRDRFDAARKRSEEAKKRLRTASGRTP